MKNLDSSHLPARRIVLVLAALAVTAPSRAGQGVPEFADLSIEELANIQVTSVSKKPERLLDAPASVYVITADEIRRSGASTLPEALRLAPNLQAGQLSNTGYSITSRGMNGSSNSAPNKLLVMIDGRSVYTPLFSGVFWDAQDVLLEDIERIEVISGPGGTLWGVNAVNGVINITTKSAHATGGRMALLRAATNGADAAFRHGETGGAVDWRVYGKVFRREHNELASGARVNDAWRQGQVGLRADWERGADSFSVNANAYKGREEQPEPGLINIAGTNQRLGDIRIEGANLTGRWQRALAGGASLTVQAYLDHTRRVVPPSFTESLTLADVQMQHSLPTSGAHSIVWGVNYRYSWDRVTNSDIVAFLPARANQTWASLFAQDEIRLRDDLRLTLGARAERNPYTGTEFLPTARLSWKAGTHHAFWTSVSRTVRAPSRLDVDAYIPGKPPYVLAGGPAVRSEVARVVEVGVRGQPMAALSYSVALFHHQYDHLRTQELLPSRTQVAFANLMEGEATGLEVWGKYQVTPSWRLAGGFTALREKLWLKPGSNDVASVRNTGKDPSHTIKLRSTYSFDEHRELEIGLRKVGRLDVGPVPGYTTIDARFGWRLRPGLELSVSGHNLNGAHAEFGGAGTRIEAPRTVAVKMVWQR